MLDQRLSQGGGGSLLAVKSGDRSTLRCHPTVTHTLATGPEIHCENRRTHRQVFAWSFKEGRMCGGELVNKTQEASSRESAGVSKQGCQFYRVGFKVCLKCIHPLTLWGGGGSQQTCYFLKHVCSEYLIFFTIKVNKKNKTKNTPPPTHTPRSMPTDLL